MKKIGQYLDYYSLISMPGTSSLIKGKGWNFCSSGISMRSSRFTVLNELCIYIYWFRPWIFSSCFSMVVQHQQSTRRTPNERCTTDCDLREETYSIFLDFSISYHIGTYLHCTDWNKNQEDRNPRGKWAFIFLTVRSNSSLMSTFIKS